MPSVKKSDLTPKNVVKATAIKAPVRGLIRKFMGDADKPLKGVKNVQWNKGQLVGSKTLEREVVFGSLYTQEGMSGALKPPYDPDLLYQLVETNNALQPCIDAMVTNVDGTGFEVVLDDDAEDHVEQVDADTGERVEDPALTTLTMKLKKFFQNPWPGISFMQMRKRLRRDLETTGNAYIEVIRNSEGKLALMRRMDPCITRIMRLGYDTFNEEVYSPVLDMKVMVPVKRRRYVQYVFGKLVYFKEFGSPLHLSSVTGQWEDGAGAFYNFTGQTSGVGGIAQPAPGQTEENRTTIPLTERATEVVHLVCIPHSQLPYGIPRWIPQIPSVLGSRRAEEFNLGFFDQGGVPPMMIVIQGGQAADDVEEAVKNLFYSAGPQKTTAAVLQVQSTGGTLENAGAVKVTVERFGQDRQKDQLFQAYDDNCESKIRRAWRLPPLFVGSVRETNYSNMLSSARSAESQVFHPEREHFDEMVTSVILPEIVDPEFRGQIKYRSLPLAMKDIDNQVKVLDTVLHFPNAITPQELVDTVNEVTGLDIKAATPEERAAMAQEDANNAALGIKTTAQAQMDAGVHPSQLAEQAQESQPSGQSPAAVSAQSAKPKPPGAIAPPGEIKGFKKPQLNLVKKILGGEVNPTDALAEEAAELILRNDPRAPRMAQDCAEYVMRNPEQRTRFGQKAAKRLFVCNDPKEADAAAKLADKLVFATAR